jgi:hypothetical protein
LFPKKQNETKLEKQNKKKKSGFTFHAIFGERKKNFFKNESEIFFRRRIAQTSSMLPYSVGVGPLIVPDPNKSPG